MADSPDTPLSPEGKTRKAAATTFVRVVLWLIKLAVTFALLWLAFSKVDLTPLAARLGRLDAGWALMAIGVLFVQLLLTGLRWYYVGQSLQCAVPLSLATRLILVGQFFNQVLPSSVGGDGVRAWLLSREGISLKRALASVICDRALALLLLMIIVAFVLPVLTIRTEVKIPSAWTTLMISVEVTTVAGLSFLVLLANSLVAWLMSWRFVRPLGIIIRDLRHVLLSSDKSLRIVGISVAVQVILVISIYFCASSLGIRLSMTHMLLLPSIMLVSSIPVSFAGWGLREGSMVVGLGALGVASADALAVSICFGLCQLLIGLPGAVIAIAQRYKARRHEDNVLARVTS